MEQLDLKDKVLDNLPTNKTSTASESNQNKNEKSQPTAAKSKEENKATAAPSSSSWASLFKASASANPVDNTIKTTAESQSEKPSSILSIQNEQEKENESSKSDKKNLLTLIAMAKDQRAIKLAGIMN